MLRYLFLDFHFYHSIGKSEKGIEKLFLGLACARIINKNNTTVHENSFANPFPRFPNRVVKRKSMKFGFGLLN